MAISTNRGDRTHFLVKRSQLTISKIFVEFYLPEYQERLDALSNAPYPLKPLKKVSSRLFDGPFGSNRKVDMYQDNGIPYIRVKDVLSTGIDLSNIKYISEEKHQELNRSRVIPGNVLITIAGRVGTAAVFPDSLEEGSITGHIAGIELPEDINPHYVAAFLNSQFGDFQVSRLSHRTTRPEMNLKEVGRILISVPPRSLQDQIAQVMQEAYGDRQKKLEVAEKLLSSSSRVVLEELDLEISELKDEKYFTVGISKIAGGRFDLDLYNTCYVGLVSILQKRFNSNLTPLKSISHQITSGSTPLGSKYVDEGVPFLRVQNLNDEGEISFDDCLFVSQDFAKTLKRAMIQNGDILLVIVGATIGKSAVVKNIEPPLVTNQALARIRIRENVDLLPDFLQAFLSSPAGQIQISALKRPVAQGNLNLTETGQILVPIVPLDQQKKVINRIQSYRTEAKRLRSQAEAVIAAAKARVERMILGEETVE